MLGVARAQGVVPEEAERFGAEVPHPAKAHRVDLRDLPLVTIDDESAKDFDDAVYVESRQRGGWRLIVAIADVSHYVHPGTALDNEAHKRGLELHAWFNPFRARYKSRVGAASSTHISRKQPRLVKSYGGYQWLDPAEPAAQAHSLAVILDVAQRYAVDGVHLDDYFYPYPDSKRTSFPDETSWKRSKAKISRKDWRRMHINHFIKRLHTEIHKVKPHVKFGISPFGIWRPGYPKQIRGLDAYDELYADARLWLREGWLDYCAPQLY